MNHISISATHKLNQQIGGTSKRGSYIISPFLMSTILYVAVFLCLLFSAVPASAEPFDLKPMALLYDDDAVSLGLGLPEPVYDRPDLRKPARLIEYESRFSQWYERESVLNGENETLASYSRGTFGLVRLDLPVALAFSAREFVSDYNRLDNYIAGQNTEYSMMSMGARPFKFLRLGASLPDEAYEFSVIPVEYIEIGSRRFKRSININASLIATGTRAEFSFAPESYVNELTIRMFAPGIFRVDLASDINMTSDAKTLSVTKALNTGYVESSGIALTVFPERPLSWDYRYKEYKAAYLSAISIDETPGGHIGIESRYDSRSLTLKYFPMDSKNRFFAAMKNTRLLMSTAGTFNAEHILSFWENLFYGDRIFNGNLSWESIQYHLGMESAMTGRLTLRGGLQYIDSRQDGELVHWTPTPIIGIGRFDEDTILFPYKKARFAGLSLGFSYRLGDVEISYGITQLVPLYIEKVAAEAGAGAEAEIDIRDERANVSDIWEKIKEDPGGNIQKIEVTWRF
jgi:hypothetical protein